MSKRLIIIGGSVTVVLLAVLVGAFFAAPMIASASSRSNLSGGASTTTNPNCELYLQNLASKLNVSVSTLEQGQTSAREAVISQLVKDGKLTQAQANTLEQRITSHQACTGKKTGMQFNHFVVGQFLKNYGAPMENTVAQGLHLSSSQLVSELKSGKSLHQIATAQNVSETQLKTIVTNALKSALQQAVTSGTLTQTQSNSISQYMQKHPAMLTLLINKHMHGKALFRSLK
jgi:AraC-like DNA-binding protein